MRSRVILISGFALAIWAGSVGYAVGGTPPAQFPSQQVADKAAVDKAWRLLDNVRLRSFPEISESDLNIKPFNSNSTFFKARFSFGRYFTFRNLKTTLYINPAVFDRGASDESVEAILAHELAHVLYYFDRNRLSLLGLIRLTCDDFEASFERKADLTAIARGYGPGLIEYRQWLYKNIPDNTLKKKMRNYFSPNEIVLLMDVLKTDPALFASFSKKIPRDIDQIVRATRNIDLK
ncbi:MAG: hypothetical protein ABIV48_05430 [Pyrinomonadaceae bacterium]